MKPETPRTIVIDYTNHRGETATRTIEPCYLWWGATEWHPQEQWLLHAWDYEKDAPRDFAFNGIHGIELREKIAADTRISVSEPASRPPLLRKAPLNVDAWLRAEAFYEWLQQRGYTEVLTEFREQGLLDASLWRGR